MDIWLSVLGEYGFPVAVTFYLLYRIEKKLDQLNHSVLYLVKLWQQQEQLLESMNTKHHVRPVNHLSEKI